MMPKEQDSFRLQNNESHGNQLPAAEQLNDEDGTKYTYECTFVIDNKRIEEAKKIDEKK